LRAKCAALVGPKALSSKGDHVSPTYRHTLRPTRFLKGNFHYYTVRLVRTTSVDYSQSPVKVKYGESLGRDLGSYRFSPSISRVLSILRNNTTSWLYSHQTHLLLVLGDLITLAPPHSSSKRSARGSHAISNVIPYSYAKLNDYKDGVEYMYERIAELLSKNDTDESSPNMPCNIHGRCL
jgi:hypothetical protein